MTATTLDGRGSLQEQTRRAISEEIVDGAYPPGAQLPTEKDYAERLGVSLITVRNALASLVQTGSIERASGRGTFVSGPKLPCRIALTAGWTAGLRAAGVPVGIEVVVAEPGPPPEDVRRALKLAKGTSAFHLERVAVVEERPAILLDSWLRRSVVRTIAPDGDVVGICSDGRLELAYADDREAELLRLPWGAPLFAYESTTRDAAGRPIERARAMFDANRFSLTIPAQPATRA